MNKKGGTLGGVFVALVLTIGLFFGMYDYIAVNYESANITDNLNYSESYQELQIAETELNDSIEEIKVSAKNIAEADGSALTIAWNGLTGLAATIGIFFDIIPISLSVWNAMFPALGFLPSWVKLLAEMIIVIWIILIIVGALKGEAKT